MDPGGGPGGLEPSFCVPKKYIAIACQRGTKVLPKNDRRSKLSLTTYEFFSSSSTFSDTDLAQDTWRTEDPQSYF